MAEAILINFVGIFLLYYLYYLIIFIEFIYARLCNLKHFVFYEHPVQFPHSHVTIIIDLSYLTFIKAVIARRDVFKKIFLHYIYVLLLNVAMGVFYEIVDGFLNFHSIRSALRKERMLMNFTLTSVIVWLYNHHRVYLPWNNLFLSVGLIISVRLHISLIFWKHYSEFNSNFMTNFTSDGSFKLINIC